MLWIYISLLCLLAVVFVLAPFYMPANKNKVNRNALNISIYRQRLEELQSESLAPDEFKKLKNELQQNLLIDVTDEEPERGSETGTGTHSEIFSPTMQLKGAGLPLALGLLIPLLSLLAYADWGFSWGASTDLEISTEIEAGIHTPEKLLPALDKLSAQLGGQPENHQGWFLLAQSNLSLGRYNEAARAFEHLLQFYHTDAGLAAYHAESLFLGDKKKITDRVRQAVGRALKLNPKEVTMLEIKGMDAYQQGRAGEAVELFKQALATNPENPRAGLLKDAIKRIEKEMGVALSDPEDLLSLKVSVKLVQGLKLPKDHTVFVFARAVKGPPMPLAITRITVADLPATLNLTESMAMMPNMSIADFEQLEVVARTSGQGLAESTPDDYEVVSPVINMKTAKLNSAAAEISLTLEHKVGGY